MVKQRLLALVLLLDTVYMVAVSRDATIALLTIPMAILLMVKKVNY